MYREAGFASVFSLFRDDEHYEIIVTKKDEDGIYYHYLNDKGQVVTDKTYFMVEDEFIISDYVINYLGKRPYLLINEYES